MLFLDVVADFVNSFFDVVADFVRVMCERANP